MYFRYSLSMFSASFVIIQYMKYLKQIYQSHSESLVTTLLVKELKKIEAKQNKKDRSDVNPAYSRKKRDRSKASSAYSTHWKNQSEANSAY
jgi:hypothetical protein